MSFSSPSVSSSSSSSSGYQLTSLSNGSALQVTGLASGLNTDQIVQELMAIQSQPVTNMQHRQTVLQDQVAELQAIQTALQKVATDAQALQDPSLFANTQTVTSTDPTTVSAAATNAGAGAAVGGYGVAVTALATSEQTSYTFTSPSAGDTITVTNQSGTTSTYTLAANATAQDLVNQINSDTSGTVWATTYTDSSGNTKIALSDRTTGTAASFTASSSGSTLSGAVTTAGQDASYTINGGAVQTSHSNTVSSAIPGVTLTLNGTTATGSSVTVNVGAPGPSTQTIQTALQTFVGDYNSAITLIQTQINQQPNASDPSQGTLFGDPTLSSLLSSLRQGIYATQSGAPSTVNTLLDIGISTGATTGTGTPSQNAINGDLTLNTATLTSALQSNPSGVQQLLQGFSQSFSSLVNNEAAAGGTIGQWIQSDDSQVTQLGGQITSMQAELAVRENMLVQQFAQMESALSQNQSTSSWLTSQIASLPVA